MALQSIATGELVLTVTGGIWSTMAGATVGRREGGRGEGKSKRKGEVKEGERRREGKVREGVKG